MKPYTLDRTNKVSVTRVSKANRKKLAKKKLNSRREKRKADRKALRDEYGF